MPYLLFFLLASIFPMRFFNMWVLYHVNDGEHHVYFDGFIALGREDTFLKCVSTRWVMNRFFFFFFFFYIFEVTNMHSSWYN
jgi:hypothetical protein